MKGNRVSLILAALAASLLTPMSAAAAHGENDARIIMHGTEIGPYTVSLWNVLGDTASDLGAHVIVMVDGTPIDDRSVVVVEADNRTLPALPSTTIDGAWETTTGVAPGAVLTLSIASGDASWTSPPVVVPMLAHSNLLMRAVGSIAVFVTTAAVYWLASRAMRVWRRPIAAHAG